jgi:hypothetical protein
MKRLSCLGLLLAAGLAGADPTRVLPPDTRPADARLGPPRALRNKDFFLRPPDTRQEWQKRRQEVREQVLVATGLWPMPPKTDLRPVVHGKINRDGYTIEKVFFASLPGHYVTGNLYRPTGKKGKLPGVLCPHGHWARGRFFEANDAAVKAELAVGGEKTREGARYPLQARCAQLARMGCVVFHYDMVGYADSTALGHSAFSDADGELRLQSLMGLQTWNSIRALDFLTGLPDVDPARVGVTGASGGGTQTFILCAIDDRPAVAFPAVMVSTQMQGGCSCENCSFLRIGTGNVELAALFAPKPLAMTGANDWTIDIERKGLPELKKVYKLYGAEDRVAAWCYPKFGHNYNQVSREKMYNWFNRHLHLGFSEPVVERPFVPVPPKELAVFDRDHPRPKDSGNLDTVRRYLSETSDKQMADLKPKDAAGLAEYRRVFGTALRVMLSSHLPRKGEVESKKVGEAKKHDGATFQGWLIGRKGAGEQVPAVLVRGPAWDGTVVVWVSPEGKASVLEAGKLAPAARRLLDGKAAILAVDVFGTGELAAGAGPAVEGFAGYTFGYNRPWLANRAHDVLTAVGFAGELEGAKKVHLLGLGRAGPWALLARALAGDAVARTAADMDRFRFEKVRTTRDEMMLPGGLKYVGMGALAALAAPNELFVHNHRGSGCGEWLKAVYAATGQPARLQRSSLPVEPVKVAEWLVR